MTTSTLQDRFNLITQETATPLTKFAGDVEAGLTECPKSLPYQYFYDHEGSLLFEEICQLPEYYLTRAERKILQERAVEVASLFPEEVTLVELGSGNAVKTRLLIEAFFQRHGALRYLPVDISPTVLEESSQKMLEEFPTLEISAIIAEYHDGLNHLKTVVQGAKLILWLGSSVGNMERSEAASFLQGVQDTMSPWDRLLVGIDLRKDRAVLEKAYDDSQGVTAQFNRNILTRINRELGGHFDITSFDHRAVYKEAPGRVEIHLVSTRDQRVFIEHLGLEVSFKAGETIHTENSYKYNVSEIETLATAAGLRIERQWFDAERRFSENLFAPTP